MLRTLLLSLATITSLSVANAQAQPAASGDMTSTFILIAIMGAMMYFMIIRPQKKRQKEHQQLMAALKVGTEVISTAGIVGKVAKLEDNYVHVEIAPNVVIKFQRAAIVNMIPKGTIQDGGDKKGKKDDKKDDVVKTEG